MVIPKCPNCKKGLKFVSVVTYSRLKWKKDGFEDESFGGDVTYSCFECDYKFEYEECEKLGFF